MLTTGKPMTIATRGSALALAQANLVFDQCRAAFPKLKFEIKILKTTGDKLQRASLASPAPSLPKGLFTKELEVALLKHQADLAVHSLKDLPAELPAGLKLGAVSKRADARDVLIYRDAEFLKARAESAEHAEWVPGQDQQRGFKPKMTLKDFPPGITIATSSPRRRAQLLMHRPDFKVVEIRGNVVTRLHKLAERAEFDALVLAAAGLARLTFNVTAAGPLKGDAVPEGLLAIILQPDVMLPCVGQGALGIEVRENDERMATICDRLNHYNTDQCVAAERAFLKAMGGGCQSPVAAYAEVVGERIRVQGVSFQGETVARGEVRGALKDAVALGAQLSAELNAVQTQGETIR